MKNDNGYIIKIKNELMFFDSKEFKNYPTVFNLEEAEKLVRKCNLINVQIIKTSIINLK